MPLDWLLAPTVWTSSIPEEGVLGLADRGRPHWPGRPRVALLLHGVACTWRFMSGLARDLATLEDAQGRPRYGGVATLAIDWRDSIDRSARELSLLLERLSEHAWAFDLYGYSQGGLIARWALATRGPGPRVEHCVTFNSPHRGSPMSSITRWWAFRLGAAWLQSVRQWDCDGLRDVLEDSHFLSAYSSRAVPTDTRLTYVAGDAGGEFLGGWTQRFFGEAPNDGVVAVDSQLDLVPDACRQSLPGPSEEPGAGRLVLPWHHFTVGLGLPLHGRAAGAPATQAALLQRIVAPAPTRV